MFMQFVMASVEFLAANYPLVGYIMAAVQFVKEWAANYSWYRGIYATILAFVLGFAFAIPPEGFVGIDIVQYIFNSVALGGSAAGIFKVGADLLSRANTTLVIDGADLEGDK